MTEDGLADFPFRHSLHDRLGNHRADAQFVAARWADPTSRVVVLRGTELAVTDDGARLAWVAPGQAPAGERLLLGGTGGVTHFAVLAHGHDESRVEFDDIEVSVGTGNDIEVSVGTGGDSRALHFAPLRQLAQLLPDVDASYAVHATSLAIWHLRHPRCSVCGAHTEMVGAGDSRRCAECGTSHFPRKDPAVIMTVVDDAGRVLLGHNVARKDGWYSTLAGFVDPGETPEDAVAREVFEEVGVRVDRVTYLGSQPWPFPSSLMLGFEAHASSMAIDVDGLEITAARWFTRGELRAAVESGEVGLPTTISIAGALLTRWYGEELPSNVLQT